ncbi:MAG: PHP domain-containing protein, partial [Oscillospiraceae bacterium]|nr:PHP domain-containing protein [Oscillospiraceae bacterium]
FYPDVHFVTTLIRASGGISVMAHPKVYDSFDLLSDLVKAGELDGVEIWHTSADENDRARLMELAEKHDLIRTGGSDFHGFYNHYAIQIGSDLTPEDQLNRILNHKGKA